MWTDRPVLSGSPQRAEIERSYVHDQRHLAGEQRRHLLGAQPPLEHPLARVALERLGQEVVKEENLDPASPHHLDERVELSYARRTQTTPSNSSS